MESVRDAGLAGEDEDANCGEGEVDEAERIEEEEEIGASCWGTVDAIAVRLARTDSSD
jgi:hypothetical protein